jgi:hypothetical protein
MECVKGSWGEVDSDPFTTLLFINNKLKHGYESYSAGSKNLEKLPTKGQY